MSAAFWVIQRPALAIHRTVDGDHGRIETRSFRDKLYAIALRSITSQVDAPGPDR